MIEPVYQKIIVDGVNFSNWTTVSKFLGINVCEAHLLNNTNSEFQDTAVLYTKNAISCQ